MSAPTCWTRRPAPAPRTLSLVLRLALTPRWLGGLLLAAVAAAVCCALGLWQWDRGEGLHGSLQNTAYAFNWWLFALLCLLFWVRALRDQVRTGSCPPRQVSAATAAASEQRAATVAAESDDDPEVARWNAWLADLAQHPRR